MVRTRIAPSPTGFPHIGTVYQALLDRALVARYGGSLILRLEDTDRKRFVEGSEEVIYDSLDWVGIKIDEGPREGGDFGPYRQSERLDIYRRYAQELLYKGYAYYCFCSVERLELLRQVQEARREPTLYDKSCRSIPLGEAEKRVKNGESVVVRMKVPENETILVEDTIRGNISFNSNLIDDQVILKSDGFPTYHLAIVVDDHLMEITHPIRGEEWLSSYPKHKLLYNYFGWKMPHYTHLPLLKNPDGSKVSKRHGHTSINWYREQGILPEALTNFLTNLVWNHPKEEEIYSFEEFAELFEFKDISIVGPRFDLKKLEWMNGEYIRKTQNSKLKTQIFEFLDGKYSEEKIEKVVPLVKERIKKFSDFEPLAGFLFTNNITYSPDLVIDKDLLIRVLPVLEKLSAWESKSIEDVLRAFAQENNIKASELFTTIRNAVSGSRITPPLFESLAILGRERTLERLQKLT